MTCSVEGCGSPIKARLLCNRHYKYRKSGARRCAECYRIQGKQYRESKKGAVR